MLKRSQEALQEGTASTYSQLLWNLTRRSWSEDTANWYCENILAVVLNQLAGHSEENLRDVVANMLSQNLTRRVAQMKNPKICDQNLQDVPKICEHVLADFPKLTRRFANMHCEHELRIRTRRVLKITRMSFWTKFARWDCKVLLANRWNLTCGPIWGKSARSVYENILAETHSQSCPDEEP